jgi:hypothetical protein
MPKGTPIVANIGVATELIRFVVSGIYSGDGSSGRTVGGNGTEAHDEDDPKATMANHVGHCTVLNIRLLHFVTASTAEHEIISNFSQNCPHYIFISQWNNLKSGTNTSINDTCLSKTEGYTAENSQNFVTNQLGRIALAGRKEQNMKEREGNNYHRPNYDYGACEIMRLHPVGDGLQSGHDRLVEHRKHYQSRENQHHREDGLWMRQLMTLEKCKNCVLIHFQMVFFFLILFR